MGDGRFFAALILAADLKMAAIFRPSILRGPARQILSGLNSGRVLFPTALSSVGRWISTLGCRPLDVEPWMLSIHSSLQVSGGKCASLHRMESGCGRWASQRAPIQGEIMAQTGRPPLLLLSVQI